MHNGVRLPDDSLLDPPFVMFVDDLLYAEIRTRIKQSMPASIESLFQTMGRDCEWRRSNLSEEKIFDMECHYIQTQLVLEINTRTMTVSLPRTKKDDLISILRHWHDHRKSFVIKEASSLLGKLNYAAEVVP